MNIWEGDCCFGATLTALGSENDGEYGFAVSSHFPHFVPCWEAVIFLGE